MLARVAAHGLGPGAAIAGVPLTDLAFADLLTRAGEERIIGHLVAAIEDGALDVTDTQRRLARAAYEDALAVDLVLERLLVQTSITLTSAGIAHRALKGAAVAHTSYPDPALRSFGDVDILVDGRQFDTAIALLSRGGGHRRYLEPRPNFVARFGKGVCVVTASGREIDVHRVFAAGPFGLAIDPDDLFATPEIVRIAGVDIPALDATLRFLHACYHASLGGPRPRLSALRDVAQTARVPPLDPERAWTLARRWRGRAVVQRAVSLARESFAATIPFEPADAYVADRFETAALDAYVSNRASYAAQAVMGVWAIRGFGARAAYVRALLVPSRAYVGERDGSYARRLYRGVELARRFRPRARP